VILLDAQRPGSMGSQKLSPRNTRVADKATERLTPTSLSVSTDAASEERLLTSPDFND
jgi:hypothetical protein